MGSLPTCSNGPAGSGLAEMDLRVLAPAVGSHGSLGRQGFIENDIPLHEEAFLAPEDAGWIGFDLLDHLAGGYGIGF